MALKSTYTVISEASTKAKSRQCINASRWKLRVQEMRLLASFIEAGWPVLINEEQRCAFMKSFKETTIFKHYQALYV